MAKKKQRKKHDPSRSRPTGDPAPSYAHPSRPGRKRARLSSFARTIVVAVAAPLLVFSFLAVSTADFFGYERKITSWSVGGNVVSDKGAGLTFDIGAQPVVLVTNIPTDKASFSRFEFTLTIPNASAPTVNLLYRNSKNANTPFGYTSLTGQIRGPGPNRIALLFDEAPRLVDANQLALQLSSTGGPSRVTVSEASVSSVSYITRALQMTGALLRHKPLTQGGNNFVNAQTVAGRGFLFIFWIALPIAIIALLVRRFVLHESLSLIGHGALTIIVFVVMIDLRNMSDYIQHANAAVSTRAGSADIYEYLDSRETYFPWFADTVRAVREELPDGGHYCLRAGRASGGFYEARARAAYYSRPASMTSKPENADVVILYNSSPKEFAESERWALVPPKPEQRVMVFRKRK